MTKINSQSQQELSMWLKNLQRVQELCDIIGVLKQSMYKVEISQMKISTESN